MKKKNRRIASKIKRLNIVLAKIAPFNKCQKIYLSSIMRIGLYQAFLILDVEQVLYLRLA